MSKKKFRAATNEGSFIMFWADTESEDTDDLAPVTVLKMEQYAKVIYNGRMGLIKAGDVRRLTERAPAESSDGILLSETQSAQIRLADVDRFPAHNLPEVAGKRKLPPFFHQIEEAVDAGFHVPNGIIKHSIADYLLGALQRPNGISLATEIVKWASERPSVVSQIPPLLADMPPEVCRAFSNKAADFLAKSETTPEPYTSLFKVALGFPPSGHLCKEGISSYQPYGIVGKQAHFHPSPVFPDDVVNCRLLIEEKDAEGALAAFSVTPKTADSGVLADEEGNNRMAAHHTRSTHSKAAPNKRQLVFVPSTEANISALCKALQSPIPLLIEGDTGTGKTVSVSAAAERMDMEVIRFNLSSGTTVQDLVGRMQITDNKLELSLQPFTEAFSRGSLLVLDECNLAQEEVLATLETALDTGLLVIPDPTNPARAAQEIRRHPMFRLIITQNPCTGLFVGKRHRLSAAFLSRFFPMTLASFLPDEFIDIAKARLVDIMKGTDEMWQTVAKVLGRVHSAASKYVTQNKGVSGVETSLTVFTCRDIINAVKLVTFAPSGEVDVAELVEPVKRRIPASLWCMYGSRFLAAGPREEVWKIVCEICAEEGVECPAKPADSVARYLSGQTSGPNTPPDPFAKPLPAVGSVVWCADDDNVAAPRNPLIVTERVLHTWRLLDFVMNLGRPVLLVGKSGTGVSHMALGYAAYRTDRYYLSHVTSETITGMLVGQNVPAFEGKDVTKWVDGPVTEAMTQGKWLVLDDLAAASATVLERLNSVLEEDPELFIAERGGDKPKEVKLNKSFRILATAEHSQLTSLSPAFANRFTVIVCGKSDADTHHSDMTLFAQNMLFARPDANFERRGPQLLVEGNIVQSTAEEGYTGALASLELTEKHEWEVEVEHCPGGEGIVVGVAVDTKQLDLGTDLTHSRKVWGYSSIGVLHTEQTKEPKEKPRKGSKAPPARSPSKPLNVKAEKFKAGDVIKVAVSPAEKEIVFFKNGANVGTLKLARSEEDAAKPLKPFVGLNAKARVHMKFATQDAPDTQVNECTEMCVSSLSRGTYGLYSVVRAIQCARKLAEKRAVTANHLRKAFMLLEVGTWRQGGRKASEGGGMRGKRSSLGAPSLRAAAVAMLFTNEVSPSLAQLTQRVSACVGMSVPVLIVDDYHWDLKDSLFKVVEQVKATSQSTVTEWYGSLLPTCTSDKVTITRVAGPLRRALEGGTCFLIDGIAHLSSSMQAQLGPLLDTGVLSRPGEDLPVRCAPGFSVAGTCKSKELKALKDKFATKFVSMCLPRPCGEDYAAMLHIPSKKITHAAQVLTSHLSIHMDVRQFKRIATRMQKLHITKTATKDKTQESPELLWALCFASIIVPAGKSEEDHLVRVASLKDELLECGLFADEAEATTFLDKLKQPATLKEDSGFVTFSRGGLSVKVKGAQARHKAATTILPALLDIVVSVAFASAASEALVLSGPTSCKSLAVKMYSNIVSVETDTLHLTCSTDVGDLLGGIHPFSPDDYAKAVEKEKEMMKSRSTEAWEKMVKSMEDALPDVKDKGTTIFAFKDSSLTESVKLARGVMMKAANLPDSQLFVTLEELLHRQGLPLSIVSPTGCTIPVYPGAPLVLTVTGAVDAALPPSLEGLTVHRCPAYSSENLFDILESSICQKNGKNDETRMLARSVVSQLSSYSMKGKLRLASFIGKYSATARISRPAALVLGMHLLMHKQVDREELLKDKWTSDLVTESLAMLPPKGAVDDSKTMADFIKVDDKEKTIRLVDDGVTLGVAKCRVDGMQTRIDESPIVPIPALRKNLSSIFATRALRMPLLLEGAPGIGKSFLVESAAALLGAKFVRVQFSAGSTVSHLFGASIPTIENGVRVFKRQEGILGEALRTASEECEVWVLLDELNLAPPEVQQALSPMLEEGADELVVSATERYPMKHVRIFAAVNPATIGGGRSHLPPSVKDLFAIVHLQDLDCSEALWIARSKFKNVLNIFSSTLLESLLAELTYIHEQVFRDIAEGRLGQDRGESSAGIVNLRTLEKVVLLLAARLGRKARSVMTLNADHNHDILNIKSFFLQVLEVIYQWQFPSPKDRARASNYIRSIAKRLGTFVNQHPNIEAYGDGELIKFGQACMLRGAHPMHSPPLPPSYSLCHRLAALACASGSSLGVLLEGASASGKTSLVRELARICGQKLRVIPVTPNTEVSELLGMWVPWKGLGADSQGLSQAFGHEAARVAAMYISSEEAKLEENSAVVARVREELKRHIRAILHDKATEPQKIVDSTLLLCATLTTTSFAKRMSRLSQLHEKVVTMSFHFAESQLIHAINDGDWVLLDNIDWAPPAAIERLNCLLEADASFKLVERGDEEVTIKKGSGIHENFKMFFTANPSRKHASKLSSAFLNRVVRLVLQPFGQTQNVSEKRHQPADTSLPNAIFFTLNPEAVDIRFWQYLCTRFHEYATARQPILSIRCLRHCLDKWRDDIVAHSSTHTSLFLLCHNLLTTYTQVCPREADGFVKDLRMVLAETHVLMDKVKKRKASRTELMRDREKSVDVAEEEPEEEPMESMMLDSPEGQPQMETALPPPPADLQEEVVDVASTPSDDDINLDDFDEVLVKPNIVDMQDACLQSMKSNTLRERTEQEDLGSCDKDALKALAEDLCRMSGEKQGGVVEELLANLVCAPSKNIAECVYTICKTQHERFGKLYPQMTEIHLFVMLLYTMEGPDIDRLLGFEGVPYWSTTNEDMKAAWRAYCAKYRGKRNSGLYNVVNTNLRCAVDGSAEQKDNAMLTLKRWVKTVCLQMTLCESIHPPQCYRAMCLPSEIVDRFAAIKVGEYIGWPSPSSTSKRRCDDFLGKDPAKNCRFLIRGVERGLEMERISQYTDEEEILLPPFTLLKVTGSKRTDTGLEVEAEVAQMVCWDEPHLCAHLKTFLADARDGMNRIKYKITKRNEVQSLLLPLKCDNPLDPNAAAFFAKGSLPFNNNETAVTSEPLSEDIRASECLSSVSFADSEASCQKFRNKKQTIVGAAALPDEIRAALKPDSAATESASDGLCALLPCNTFTRYEAAASGVELYIPGLIKAITTNFTYNKVFATKSAGGARAYGCVIAIDAAALNSTDEGLARGYLELVGVLRAALSMNDFDPCVVLCSEAGCHCVHTSGEWDDTSTFALLVHAKQLGEEKEVEGNQGDILRLLCSMAKGMRGKAKQVFFLTMSDVSFEADQVSETLQEAEQSGVNVLGVGLVPTIHTALPKAISLSSPALLGKALSTFLQGPYAPPTLVAGGQDAVQEEEIFWGRHHASIEIEDFTARATQATTANLFSLESAQLSNPQPKTWYITVTSDAPVYVGVGSPLITHAQNLSNLDGTGVVWHSATGVTSGGKTAKKYSTLNKAYFEVSVLVVDGAFHVKACDGKDTVFFDTPCTLTEAHLLLGFSGEGEVSVCEKRGTDDETEDASKSLSFGGWVFKPAHGVSAKEIACDVTEDGPSFEAIFSDAAPGSYYTARLLFSQFVPLILGTLVGSADKPVTKKSCDLDVSGMLLVINGVSGGKLRWGLEQDGRVEVPEGEAGFGISLSPNTSSPGRLEMPMPVIEKLDIFDMPSPYTVYAVDETRIVGAKSQEAAQYRISLINAALPVVFSFEETDEDKNSRGKRITIVDGKIQVGVGPGATTLDADNDILIRYMPDPNAKNSFKCSAIPCTGATLATEYQSFSVVNPHAPVLSLQGRDSVSIQKVPMAENKTDNNAWIRAGKYIEIESSTKVSITSAKYSAAIRGGIKSGKKVWKVIITGKPNGSMVGIATKNVILDGALYRKPTTWYISNHGKCQHGDEGFEGKPFNSQINEITVKLDMDARTVQFAVDGSLIDKFLRIEEDVAEVHPLVGLYSKGQVGEYIEDVDDSNEEEKEARALLDGFTFLNSLRQHGASNTDFSYQPSAVTAYTRILGPVLHTASTTFKWDVLVKKTTQGFVVGVAGQGVELVDECPYEQEDIFVYTHHGTLSNNRIVMHYPPLTTENVSVEVSVANGVMTFAVKEPGAPRVVEKRTVKVPAVCKPFIGMYHSDTQVSVCPREGFTDVMYEETIEVDAKPQGKSKAKKGKSSKKMA